MLVLGQKLDQGILISRGGVLIAKVTVVALSRSKCRLGFEAPDDVHIVRTNARPKTEDGKGHRDARNT
jgi:sRNA-binding carbon storage regulator CsrA